MNKNIIYCLAQIPSKQEEDFLPNSVWVNGKLISFDEDSKYTNLYIHHQTEEWIERIPNTEDFETKIRTEAYQIRVEKPITMEKIITAVEKDVYALYTDEDYSNFQAFLLRETQENPSGDFIKEHTKFLRWVKNGLNIAKGITVEEAKEMMLQEIIDYDKSLAVNSFILNNFPAWLDKETRVGLVNSISIEKASGIKDTTLWLGTLSFTLPVDTAMSFLYQLELYAKECYNKTAEHKYNLDRLDIVEEILNYNYTEGYPDKLIITI